MKLPANIRDIAIDKQSPIPLYVQLKEGLKAVISKKRIGPGGKIPSETELAECFEMSRMTVRQAIRELQKEGLVYVRRGDGTYVSVSRDVQMLIKPDGFSTEMTKLGHIVHSKLISAEKVSYSDELQEPYARLMEKEANPVVVISRIRYLDNNPFAIETSFLKSGIGDGLLEKKNEPSLSIYRYIEHNLGINLSRAEHIIEPCLASAETAQELGVSEGAAVLRVDGTTFSEQGDAVEYLEGIYRGDRYRMKVGFSR